MKNNQPVTQKEIPFPLERFLVSKTDLKGVITNANDEFVRISGFTRNELIGNSHNMVRHPDMPTQVFEDLWRKLKKGQPWEGIVKNRTKNGDFYWVEAFIVPIKKNGIATGYMSVRSAASREKIKAAEALYKKLNGSQQTLKNQQKRRIPLHVSLALSTALATALLTIVGLVGLQGIHDSNRNLTDAYSEQIEPALALQKSLALMDDGYKHVVLALEHDPANAVSKQQDHALTRHTDAIAKAIREMVMERNAIAQYPADNKEKPLLDAFFAATDTYIRDGLQPADTALIEGQYDIAYKISQKILYSQFEDAKNKGSTLYQHILEEAYDRKTQGIRNYRLKVISVIAIGLSGVLFMLAVSQLQARWIRRQLRHVIQEFEAISEGVLTRPIDTARNDEFGGLNKSLAIMQTNIKVMLDNIREAVMALQQKSSDLDAQMYIVLMQSQNQYSQVSNVVTTAQNFSQSIVQVATKANDTSRIADESQQMVVICNTTMSKSMEANAHVVATVNNSSKIITELNKSIQKIGAVTLTIHTIANKTNLLALNAAIEAARAGEAGRGFAVVADEVRKLAESTTHSTSDITAIVEEIHNIADSAVSAMNLAVTEVNTGVSEMQESVKELNQITLSSQEVSSMAHQIATVANEQAEAGISVSNNMGHVAQTVEENVQIAKQASLIAKELNEVAERMKALMGEFHLFPSSPKDAAPTDRSHTNDFIEF